MHDRNLTCLILPSILRMVLFHSRSHTHGTNRTLSWRKTVVELKGSGEMFTGELNSAKD